MSAIKVITLTGLILLGIVLDLGGVRLPFVIHQGLLILIFPTLLPLSLRDPTTTESVSDVRVALEVLFSATTSSTDSPTHSYPADWKNPGPFAHYIFQDKVGVFLGVWYAFPNALFAYIGTEVRPHPLRF